MIRRMWGVGNLVTDALALGAGGLLGTADWLAGGGPPVFNARYLPVLSGAGFATGMTAVLPGGTAANPRVNLPPGQPPGGGGAAWNALSKKKVSPSNNASYYVRLHLLRQEFGGIGTWQNLVPMTSKANNNDPLSHLNLVEIAIDNALALGRPVGYRVTPIYGRLLPTFVTSAGALAVMGAAAALGAGWVSDLAEILYWETYIPSSIQTAWWFNDGWNPVPQYATIPNWVPWNAAFGYWHQRAPGGAVALTWPEWLTLGAIELLKLSLPALGTALWPAAAAALSALAVAVPAALTLESVAAWMSGLSPALLVFAIAALEELAAGIALPPGIDQLVRSTGRLAAFIPLLGVTATAVLGRLFGVL